MAKDVDLSSKEWRDIVFEGKNQDYGAYELRKNSDGRHNKAMIVIVVVIAIVFLLAFLVNTVISQAEARPEDETEQQLVELGADEQQEEEKEEEQKYEEPEVIKKEEVLATQQATDLVIKEDNLVKNEMTSQDKKKETDLAIGTVTNLEGALNDIGNNMKEKKENTVFEAPEPPKEEPKKEEKKVEDTNKVFDHVEQMPQFPGGDAALLSWISSHIKYPAIAQENNIQGRVTVRFVVTKNGTVGQAQVVRSKDPSLDKEALRVVKSLPKFTPGKQNGTPVNVWYTVPITFKLQGV